MFAYRQPVLHIFTGRVGRTIFCQRRVVQGVTRECVDVMLMPAIDGVAETTWYADECRVATPGDIEVAARRCLPVIPDAEHETPGTGWGYEQRHDAGQDLTAMPIAVGPVGERYTPNADTCTQRYSCDEPNESNQHATRLPVVVSEIINATLQQGVPAAMKQNAALAAFQRFATPLKEAIGTWDTAALSRIYDELKFWCEHA